MRTYIRTYYTYIRKRMYTLQSLQVDSSGEKQRFFFPSLTRARETATYFSCPEHSFVAASLRSRFLFFVSPRFSTIYPRVSETEGKRKKKQQQYATTTTTTTITTTTVAAATCSVLRKRRGKEKWMVGFEWICGTRFEHVSLSSGEWRVCIGTLT